LHWWFRQQYNLPPTDPRYLNATDEEMKVDYWMHVLTMRKALAEKEGVAVENLDDLLYRATVDEKIAALKQEDAVAEAAQREPELQVIPEDAERETLVDFKADQHGIN